MENKNQLFGHILVAIFAENRLKLQNFANFEKFNPCNYPLIILSTMELLDSEALAQQSEIASTPDTQSEQTSTVETPAESAQFSAPATMDELMARLEEIAAVDDVNAIDADEVAKIKQTFYHLRSVRAIEQQQAEQQEAADDAEAVEAADDVNAAQAEEQRFKELMAVVKEKRAQLRAQIEAQQAANLERKRAIVDEINSLAADADSVNQHHSRVKELQAEFKAVGEVPQQNATELWKTYQDSVEHFYDQWKVNKELRDYDFKKNLAEKQLIIDQSKELTQEPDPVIAFRRLQELHDKWREIGPVAKEYRETIWNEFKDLSAEINKRYQAYFEERKLREQENEAAKTKLCEEIEAIDIDSLKTSAEWNEATQLVLKAQEEWKKLGYASRKVNNAIFARFRQRCDEFFTAKAAHFQELKNELKNNLAEKIKICEIAEQLAESDQWKSTTDKFAKLLEQWKEVGTVAKRQSDQVWQRFTAARQTFFDRKKKALSSVRREESENLSAKQQILSRLKEILGSDVVAETKKAIVDEIQQLRSSWQQTGHVPFKAKEKLAEDYRETMRSLYDKFDINRQKARREAFVENIEAAAGDAGKLSRERERLMRALEQRRQELKTFENNLLFFNAKTNSGNALVAEMNRNISRLKADIADIEEKVKLIDSKLG